MAQHAAPRLTIGLPVYNGERFLNQAVDALLAQTFSDFELIISDNASTDNTEAMCRAYAQADPRVRYIRHPVNQGSAFNHTVVVTQGRGEFFKWASDDDLYAPDLLERCMQILDAEPDVVCAHSWTAFIDESGQVISTPRYPLVTDTCSAPERFRSLLYTYGGDDIYGIIRMPVMRRAMPYRSHHHADRTFVSEIALQGRLRQVPEPLYFRRDHPGRAEREPDGLRGRAIRLDPRRANRWNPSARLVAEYLLSYIMSVWRAPISRADKAECYRILGLWLLQHAKPGYGSQGVHSPDPAVQQRSSRFPPMRKLLRAVTSMTRVAHRASRGERE